MSRTLAVLAVITALVGVPLGAHQTGRDDAQQAPPAPPAPPKPPSSPWQDVRLDVTITDTSGTTSTKKTVSMLLAAGAHRGMIRSALSVLQNGSYLPIEVNVDATAYLNVNAPGQIMLELTVQYTPDVPTSTSQSKTSSINESLTVVVPDGKKTVISESADPQGDRKVTLEVTATIVK